MEYLKIPLEDIELSSESGTEQVLTLRRWAVNQFNLQPM